MLFSPDILNNKQVLWSSEPYCRKVQLWYGMCHTFWSIICTVRGLVPILRYSRQKENA